MAVSCQFISDGYKLGCLFHQRALKHNLPPASTGISGHLGYELAGKTVVPTEVAWLLWIDIYEASIAFTKPEEKRTIANGVRLLLEGVFPEAGICPDPNPFIARVEEIMREAPSFSERRLVEALRYFSQARLEDKQQ